ncbi:MAG: hypothetical protein HY553_05620 [Elusimicrobia bacterium]|nr:hypothetical protein [Elusimicrobiota bacterium]
MRRSLYGLSCVVSICSIVYELVLAQAMGALLGNTFLRYNVTIGLYLAALGAGSLLCARVGTTESARRLLKIEWALALLGAAGPLLMFLWDAALVRSFGALGAPLRGWLHQALLYGFDHALVIAIGVLSGFELPLLMHLAGPDEEGRILATDYAGTLAGAALFPLVLLPGLGLVGTAAAAGLLNAACALYIARFLAPGGPARWAAPAFAAAAAAAMLAFTGPLERLASAALTLPLSP